MRKGSCILTLALMGVLALLCSPASAQPYSTRYSGPEVDVGIFYDSLAPYGEWVEMRDYGWSWAPRVDRGWRPYTRGQWVMTDYGWFWDSDERFGWATYHYGRWVNDRYYGWVWVPGTEWAPAWVSWRHGNGYTGWAPLPPRATWQTRVGLSIGGLDIDDFIGPDDYAFVPDRAFLDRGVYQRVLPPTQNVTIIYVTNNVTNYTVLNDRVVNGGIVVANVERAVGRQVPRARTVDVDRAGAPRRARADEVGVFRPQVRDAPERRPAQGRSLVKGEEPPPLLVERRTQREQDRQPKGGQAEVTAKDVEQQRAKRQGAAAQQQAPRADAKTQQQRQSDQQQKTQQQQDQQRAQQAGDAKAQADKRAKDAQQSRDQQQSDQRQKVQQQQDQQRAQQASDAKAQADKPAKEAQPPRDQQQSDQKQKNQQQVDQQRAKQASDANAQQQAKEKGKNKGKDKGEKKPEASPTPPPGGQQQ